jgi:hypothetical protein
MLRYGYLNLKVRNYIVAPFHKHCTMEVEGNVEIKLPLFLCFSPVVIIFNFWLNMCQIYIGMLAKRKIPDGN